MLFVCLFVFGFLEDWGQTSFDPLLPLAAIVVPSFCRQAVEYFMRFKNEIWHETRKTGRGRNEI